MSLCWTSSNELINAFLQICVVLLTHPQGGKLVTSALVNPAFIRYYLSYTIIGSPWNTRTHRQSPKHNGLSCLEGNNIDVNMKIVISKPWDNKKRRFHNN